jgi:hypothetical protein
MMEAAGASETSVNFYQTTRRNVPEDSHLRTRCRENLKCHWLYIYSFNGGTWTAEWRSDTN